MKIIHTIAGTRVDHGGTSRSVPAICDALAAAGQDVWLVTGIPADPSIASRLPKDHSRVVTVPESPTLGRWLVGRRFAAALQRLDAHGSRVILHDHGLWLPSNRAAARFAERRQIPRVVSPRGMLSPWALQFHGWKKRLAWHAFQNRALETAAGFHATSEAEADDVRRLGLKQPVAVIPNGLDLPETMPVRQRRGPRQALFLSRVHEKKGLIPLMQAWKKGERGCRVSGVGYRESDVRGDKREAKGERREGNEDWQLVIAGPDEGGYRATVEAEVKRLGLEQCVSFVGAVADAEKWQLYVDSDLFILPSLSENFGIVVAEAMAAGLPVIASTGTPWSVLPERQLGWWVDPTPDALADALSDACSRPAAELCDMGRRASEYARREFSWERVANELVEFYGKLEARR